MTDNLPALGRVHHGEALGFLAGLPTASIDAVVTDPPYSSGGLHRGDRARVPSDKYVQGEGVLSGGGRVFPEFFGDNCDARSWLARALLWFGALHRVVRPGGIVATFTDWRMLPCMSDALQGGGFVWRGLIAWDKGLGTRAPHTGYARHQCEYILYGSRGELPARDGDGPFPGCLRYPVLQSDKHHMTGKPTPLMRDLVRMTPRDALVLDPFAGSGTTGVACVIEGRRFLGCEMSAEYVEIANRRISEMVNPPLFSGAPA